MDANTVLDGINRIGAGITGFSGFLAQYNIIAPLVG
jgi:hypothetical protein